MKKIIRYLLFWIKFRWYYYFPFFRPSNFKIKGSLQFDIFSFIEIDKDSDITIAEKVSLKKSRLYFRSAEVMIGSHAQFFNSLILVDHSSFQSDSHAKFNKANFSIYHQSSFMCGTHLLMDGSKNSASGFYAYKSCMKWGNNVNHYAYSQCNHGEWLIGDNVFINNGSQVRCDDSIKMGNNILISYECIIFDTNTHSLEAEDRRKEIMQGFPNSTRQKEDDKEKIRKAPIVIGNDVWIGTRAMIFKASDLGDKVIVGAAAVVSGLKVKDGCKVVGNPARVI